MATAATDECRANAAQRTLLTYGKARWRQQMDAVLTLPMPNRTERKILWRQAFAGIICSPEIDWIGLAKQLKISGGEIRVLAQAAVAIAQSKNAETVTLGHIQQVIEQRGK